MSKTNKTMPPNVKSNPILSHIWNEIYRKDLDGLIAVVGRRGFCKSGSCLTIGEEFDRDENGKSRFSVDRANYMAQDFINIARGKLPSGSVILWDEVGIENDARDWYSLKNRLIKYVMETIRYKNYLVLVTTPTLLSMDIATRRLLSGYLEMKGKTRDGDSAKGKFQFTQVNPKTGKIYFKKPRYWENGEYKVIEEVIIPRPSAELEKAYKIKKDAVVRDWYTKFDAQLRFMNKLLSDKSDMQLISLDELEKQIMETPYEFIDPGKNTFVPSLIEQGISISGEKASKLSRNLNIKLKRGLIKLKPLEEGEGG